MKHRLSSMASIKTLKIASSLSSTHQQTPYYTHSGLSHSITREPAEPYVVFSIITEP